MANEKVATENLYNYPEGYLTVRQMRELLEGVPGDAPLRLSVENSEYDGNFFMRADFELRGPHGEVKLIVRETYMHPLGEAKT